MEEGHRQGAKQERQWQWRCGGGRLDWRWTYGWNWSSRKVPSRDRGEGEIANLDRGIKAVKSGSGGRDLEIGIRAGRWQAEPEDRTKPSLFCLFSALVQHLENCIRKHRRSLIGQNTSLNAWRDIYPEDKRGLIKHNGKRFGMVPKCDRHHIMTNRIKSF